MEPPLPYMPKRSHNKNTFYCCLSKYEMDYGGMHLPNDSGNCGYLKCTCNLGISLMARNRDVEVINAARCSHGNEG